MHDDLQSYKTGTRVHSGSSNRDHERFHISPENIHKISTTGEISCNCNFGERVAKDPRKTCQGNYITTSKPSESLILKKHDPTPGRRKVREGVVPQGEFLETCVYPNLHKPDTPSNCEYGYRTGLPVDAEAQGITALSEAAAAGKAEVVQMLLERKASGLFWALFWGFWLCVVWGYCWIFNQVGH